MRRLFSYQGTDMVDVFYGNAADARAYWTARGYTVPVDASDDSDVDAWLLVGSEWIDGTYRSSFGGLKVGQRAQIREWPRYDAYDTDYYPIDAGTVPQEVINATYEAALRQGVSPGSLLVDYTPGKYSSVSIDGAISVKYDNGLSAASVQTQYMIIDQILYPVLTANGGGGSFASLSGSTARV